MPDIKSLTADELTAQFRAWGEPAYRAKQVLDWLYTRRSTSWDAMTNLPKALREKLAAAFTLQTLVLVRKQDSRARESANEAAAAGSRQSADMTENGAGSFPPVVAASRQSAESSGHKSAGMPALVSRAATQKFLWRLADGALIESVLIPANPALYGEASDRHTLCVSTQVGCAYGCRFCASGLEGWKRNLMPHEIVEQVLATERWRESCSAFRVSSSESGASSQFQTPNAKLGTRLVDNLVIMGMGEPLANYDHVLRALRTLNAPWGGGIGARKITISTSGLAPQIRKLADEPEQFRLALSLHGATDAVRNKLMPVNRKFPLAELTAACEHYQRRKGRMLTFEYILIAGVNDRLDQVPPLARLARRLRARVNLIPCNAVEGLPWRRPAPTHCEAFLAALEQQKVIATLRREKGGDIDAACGQLRLKTERELAGT